MAFAQNAIFRTFFRMIFTIILLGVTAGIVTVPLLLWAMPERGARRRSGARVPKPDLDSSAAVTKVESAILDGSCRGSSLGTVRPCVALDVAAPTSGAAVGSAAAAVAADV
eukprot:TRINITY_DN3201_c0_g1_i5.p2 TRINITY_DN3201_c0_g1~~TRINITY_DN3201_c0_g1_i5.p2  ORF type:complete len:111 (+),score=28.61 TRINITY_DN3201_c0_g1_i5:368-700(+)